MRARSRIRMTLGVISALTLTPAACAPGHRGPGWVPAALDPPAASGSMAPVAAAGPGDITYLAWIEPIRGASRRLCVSRLEHLRWSAPVTIAAGESLFVNASDTPALLASGPDTLVACWPWHMPGGESAIELRVARSIDGGRHWSDPMPVHHDRSPVEHGFASLAATPEGVRIAWLDARAGLDAAGRALPEGSYAMSVRATLMRADGTCGPETVIDARACDCCPTAQVAARGGALLAYRDRGDDEIRDIALRAITPGGNLAVKPPAADRWEISGCPVNGPALAARGNLVAVAWFSAARDTPGVRLARSSDGGASFAAPVRVDSGDPLGRAAVALLPNGDAVAGWFELRPGGARLMVRRVSPSGGARAADTLAAFASARGLGIPRLAQVGPALLVAWSDPAGGGRVRAALLTPL